jgi:hypothetical protein
MYLYEKLIMKRVILTEAKLRKLMVEMKFNQDMVFVSYLSEDFSSDKFKKPGGDSFYNKISGGLWACPVDSNRSWNEYVKEKSALRLDNPHVLYFRLSPNANIYSIDNFDDLSRISTYDFDGNVYYEGARGINYQYLFNNGYDGIYVSENALNELQGVEGNNYGGLGVIPGTNGIVGLNGWDVESICIFNPEVIIPVTQGMQ